MNLKQKVEKSFLRKTAADKVQYGQHVIDSLTQHESRFSGLPHPLIELTDVNSTLASSAAVAKGGGHMDIALRNNAEKRWNELFGDTADYISFIAAGDAAIITQAGFTPTSSEASRTEKPGAAVLDSMSQHEGGVAEISVSHAAGEKVTAYLYLALPADAQATTAADGTITIALAGGQKIYAKCDTHSATTVGGMEAGQMLKLVVQPVNNKGAGLISAPKSFTPQP